jgi:Zn-dependent membrane protease YugP
MFYDPLYWAFLGVGMLLSVLAAAAVKSTFARYSQVASRSGITGAQVATAILQANGITDVTVEAVAGQLTDHYDPSSKVLRLSESVHDSRSIAALGVAAHEVGHAIQHQHAYAPLKFRSAWVPMAGIGTNLGFIVIMVAFFLGGFHTARGTMVAWLGLALFASTTIFTLVTLPVEFDASRRALRTLESSGVLAADEMPGARAVLTAAALTYVAAFVASLLQLLYWAMKLGLFGQRRDD